MLLSILLVTDDTHPFAAESLKQTLLSYLQPLPAWEGQYELHSVVLSGQEILEVSGNLPGINALMVKQGHVARCAGNYVWVLPSFAVFSHAEEAFSALVNILAVRVGAVALEAGLDVASAKVELQNNALCLLQPSQHFDEFRYILPKQDLEECYRDGADYLTLLTYLSLQEKPAKSKLYARIPCQLVALKSLSSPSMFKLCLGYFSGTRPWQREALNLPRSLIFKMDATDARTPMPAGQLDTLRHFLFSACSALEYFATSMFSETVATASKEKAFDLAHEVLSSMDTLARATLVPSRVMQNVTQTKCFLAQWKSNAADGIASNNVNPVKQQRSPLNGIWWLGRDLKDQLNQLGKARLQSLIDELRSSVEQIAAKRA